MLAALALVLAEAATAGGWSSGRPPECSQLVDRDANVWEHAKSPDLRRYCDLVASAASKLSGARAELDAALRSVHEAEALVPGHAGAPAIAGRALEALGETSSALETLRGAIARDARVLDDPLTLLSWARVLARSGSTAEACDAYFSLLPRSSSLPTSLQGRTQIEAGLVAMGRGPTRISDAIAAFRDAARSSGDALRPVASLALALAESRSGEVAGARATADRQRRDATAWLSISRARDAFSVAPSELLAVQAFALEIERPSEAPAAWAGYLAAAPDSPWVGHAQGRLAALRSAREAPRSAK
jgi:tetratricopeptide (TPR) repeat protein